MKNTKLYLIGLIAFGMLLGCGKKEQTGVNIVANVPLTGMFAVWGSSIQSGSLLAMDDINLSSSLGQVKLNFTWDDNTGKPAQTVSLLQKHLLNPIDVYISGIKPQSMSIFDQLLEQEIPHVIWVFDAHICKEHESVFRTTVSYKYEPEQYLKYVRHTGAKRIAITYVNLPHVAEEMTDIVLPGLNEMNISQETGDIMIEIYAWDQKDYKNIIAKFKAFNPDLILLNGFQPNLVGLVKALRENDMIRDGNVIGTYDMIDAAEILSPEELEGVRAIVPRYNSRAVSENTIQWKQRYRAKFNRSPLYIDAYGYDMTMILNDAAQRVALPATHQDWYSAIQQTKIEGITGMLEFDEDGDLKVELDIAVFRNGQLIVDTSIQ